MFFTMIIHFGRYQKLGVHSNQYSLLVFCNEIFFFILGWFGIRKDFSQFLLSVCPFLQEYANIAYSAGRAADHNERGGGTQQPIVKEKNHKKSDLAKPVVPVISIDMPD